MIWLGFRSMQSTIIMYLLISCCLVVQQALASSKSALQPVMRGQSQEDRPALEMGSILTTHEHRTSETICSIKSDPLLAAFHLNKGEPVASLYNASPRDRIHNNVITEEKDAVVYRRKGDEPCEEYFERIHAIWYQESRYANEVNKAVKNERPVVDEFVKEFIRKFIPEDMAGRYLRK